MLALYRDGRPADALAHYQHIRGRLVDELGTDPGLDLTRLHQRILTADPTLAPPATGPRTVVLAAPEPSPHALVLPRFAPPAPEASARPGPATGRSDLPRDVSHFTGRTEELRRLLDGADDLTSATVFAIDGMAGVGKTALAVHAAHRLGVRYPDGSLFLDLHGHTPGHEPLTSGAGLDKLLRATGVPGAEIPDDLDERAALWRSRSAGRRLLLILDNAADSSQIRPMLPGTPGCRVLVTSRRRLVELDTTATLSLDVPPPDEALALFARVIGDYRVRAEPAAAREVLDLCGQLPLAIGMVAARLRSRPAWTVRHLSRRLREERLAEIATGVAAAFTMSYEHLSPDQRQLFRLLGMHPGADCDAHLVAALLATDVNEAERLLEQLVDLHLLQQPRPGRYRFHDLLREHARSIARAEEPEASHHESLQRILDYFLFTAARARRRFDPGQRLLPLDIAHPPAHVPPLDDHSRAVAWCETEATNLAAVIDHAAEHGRHTHTWQLAHVLQHFFDIRGRTCTHLAAGQRACAEAYHRQALDLAHAIHDLYQRAQAHEGIGEATLTTVPNTAYHHLREALTIYTRLGLPQAASLSTRLR